MSDVSELLDVDDQYCLEEDVVAWTKMFKIMSLSNHLAQPVGILLCQ